FRPEVKKALSRVSTSVSLLHNISIVPARSKLRVLLRLQAVHKILCMHHDRRGGRHSIALWLFQRRMQNWTECEVLQLDRAQPGHQSLKQSLLLVLIAVMDAGATSMAPNLGGDEEKSEACDGQCCLLVFGG